MNRFFEGLKLKNYTNSGRNIKEFALLTTSDDALAGDFGTAGWQPIVAEQNPTGLINYLSWAQGARIVSIDAEYNATTWAGEHINDGDTSSRWISRSGRNIIEYNFDTDEKYPDEPYTYQTDKIRDDYINTNQF